MYFLFSLCSCVSIYYRKKQTKKKKKKKETIILCHEVLKRNDIIETIAACYLKTNSGSSVRKVFRLYKAQHELKSERKLKKLA